MRPWLWRLGDYSLHYDVKFDLPFIYIYIKRAFVRAFEVRRLIGEVLLTEKLLYIFFNFLLKNNLKEGSRGYGGEKNNNGKSKNETFTKMNPQIAIQGNI